MKWNRAEQETTIRWDEEDKTAHVYTASPVVLRKLNKLCDQFPDIYQRTLEEFDGEKMVAARYTVYKGLVRFAKPRKMSEAQREVAAERLSRMRSGNA